MGSRLESNSNAVRKRIEAHAFEDEGGDEYGASTFGGFNDYFRRKKIKLQNLDVELRSQTDKPSIFRGVVAVVNGYTQPSLRDLHRMIVEHGGAFLQYLDGKTMATHIIASNLTPKKKIEFRKYRIVKPAWVVDSIRAGQLLAWDAYRVLDEGRNQHVLGFDGGSIVSQASNLQSGYRDQTAASWYTDQVRDVANQIDGRQVDGLDAPNAMMEELEPSNNVSLDAPDAMMEELKPLNDVSLESLPSLDHRDIEKEEHSPITEPRHPSDATTLPKHLGLEQTTDQARRSSGELLSGDPWYFCHSSEAASNASRWW